jgi:hypothetical protein
MAMTGQAVLVDADSVIVTPLGVVAMFKLGIVSSRASSTKCIDLRVRFICANSVRPWLRSFSVPVILPPRRNPACAKKRALWRVHRGGRLILALREYG